MAASIRVESGIAAGTNYWIDRPVLRIGSDPQCEICLPTAELAPHALTLEYRDGSYRAYNRGASPIVMGLADVAPGGSEVWREAQTMCLAGDLRLLLEVDGDPRPCPRPEERVDEAYSGNGFAQEGGESAPADGEPSAKRPSKSLVQMGIIGFCMLAMAGFLMMGQGGEATAPDRPTFEAIVETSLASEDDFSRTFLPRLQYAQAALVRGHDELARERFLRLRDQLVRQIESLPANGRSDAEQMLDYVEFRLGQLP